MITLEKEICEIKTDFGIFKSFKNDLVTDQLLKFSAHSRNELSMFCHFLRAGDNIIDVGAHIGSFAIPIAIKLKKQVNIFAFEPQVHVFNLLKENIFLNDLTKEITIFNGLVSFQNTRFRIVKEENNSMDCSFIPLDNEDNEVFINSYNIDNTISKGEIKENIDAFKIDVEGAELEVLNASEKTIKRNLPLIYSEIKLDALKQFNTTPEDIEKFLGNLGYHYFRNIGKRNSSNDSFKLLRLKKISHGGDFFDFIAIHQDSDRYPINVRNKYFNSKSLLTRHGIISILKKILGKENIKKIKRIIKP